jgi:hypothetical protein
VFEAYTSLIGFILGAAAMATFYYWRDRLCNKCNDGQPHQWDKWSNDRRHQYRQCFKCGKAMHREVW